MKTLCRVVKALPKEMMMFILVVWASLPGSAQNITVRGDRFYTANGERIWFNGANTPWNHWNDFGVNFDRDWWDSHYRTLKDFGINCSRIWFSCDGSGAVKSDSTGVTGVSDTFFRDCDSLFAIARRNGIYIIATMMSFDHCKDSHANYMNWRNVINDPVASQSFIDHYLVPFVNRYKTNPYLFAIDLCNEPEWISENTEDGQLPVKNLQRFFGMGAASIHANSNLPVTIGSACIKWNSDNPGHVGNYWKDSALQAAFNEKGASLDFYCVHYYGWVHKYYSSPFEKSPADYGIDDKPVIIEESPARDEGLREAGITLVQAYEKAFEKGYQGNLPWTSNGVDRNGNIKTLGPATLAFRKNHPGLVK